MNNNEEKGGFLTKLLAFIGALAVVGGVIYAVYSYFVPDYEDELEDDFDDFFEDEDEYEEHDKEDKEEKEEEAKKE